MYKKVVLAYDGSLEGAIALREGAILAKESDAHVYLLSVVPHLGGLQVAEGLHGGAVAHELDRFREVLERGARRLKQIGLNPVAKLAVGDPARVIGDFSREVGADLVVVGHRKRSMLERWWSGAAGAYISDNIGCSLLIARNQVSDASFEKLFLAKAEAEPGPPAETAPPAETSQA
jgi:nucleotide-binding universal stress UspA family protein